MSAKSDFLLTIILALFEINLFPSFVYLTPLIFEKGISGILTFNISEEFLILSNFGRKRLSFF